MAPKELLGTCDWGMTNSLEDLGHRVTFLFSRIKKKKETYVWHLSQAAKVASHASIKLIFSNYRKEELNISINQFSCVRGKCFFYHRTHVDQNAV